MTKFVLMKPAKLLSKRTLWLERNQTVKIRIFVMSSKRLMCGVVRVRLRSLTGSKCLQPTLDRFVQNIYL